MYSLRNYFVLPLCTPALDGEGQGRRPTKEDGLNIEIFDCQCVIMDLILVTISFAGIAKQVLDSHYYIILEVESDIN